MVQNDKTDNTASGSPTVAISTFDPQVEFLEIGVNVNGAQAWKVYGPDLNGTFGGMQGTGGLEAVVMDSGGAATGVINDFFGNDVATVSGGSVTWSSTHVGSYGALPGNIASPLTSAAQLAQTIGWRGHYIDPTGFYNLGARAYEPVSGRFLSCDPLGYSASTSLYNFCNGDAVNSFDADGRCPIDPGPTGSNDNGSDLGPTDTPILDAAMNLTDSNYDTASGYSGVSNLTDWGGNAQDPNSVNNTNSGSMYIGGIDLGDIPPAGNPGSNLDLSYNFGNNGTSSSEFGQIGNPNAPYYVLQNPTPSESNNSGDFWETLGTINDIAGNSAAVVGGLAGKTTYGWVADNILPTVYTSGWGGGSAGNVVTYGVEDAMKIAGYAGYGAGLVIDGAQYLNNNETGTQFLTNAGVGLGIMSLEFPADVIAGVGYMATKNPEKTYGNVPSSAWPGMFSGLGGP